MGIQGITGTYWGILTCSSFLGTLVQTSILWRLGLIGVQRDLLLSMLWRLGHPASSIFDSLLKSWLTRPAGGETHKLNWMFKLIGTKSLQILFYPVYMMKRKPLKETKQVFCEENGDCVQLNQYTLQVRKICDRIFQDALTLYTFTAFVIQAVFSGVSRSWQLWDCKASVQRGRRHQLCCQDSLKKEAA